ncbi:hypothetical protein [Muricoccus radiodurans]|uniref:hypothetical protein n=1 Tax=Muricoccus radiodurans TaxID=2231721 RepID=UPI003CF3A852
MRVHGWRAGLGRIVPGLLVAGALLLPAGAGAQSWPNDAGPSLDVLRGSIQQWDRLAPPPVDAERQAAIIPAVVDPPITTTVDVGRPIVAPLPRAPQPQVRTGRSVRQTVRRTRRGTTTYRASARGTSADALERSVNERERRLERMQQDLEADRQRLQNLRGGGPGASLAPPAGGGGFVIGPAAAATVTPR